jgi:hypothetical protein
MLTTTAIKRIKAAGHDISDEYSDERCVEFLNNALQQVSSQLIAAKFPTLVQETLVHDGDRLPKNYAQAAGLYPLRMTDNRAEIVDGSESVRFRYFATPENLVGGEREELPYDHDAINEIIVRGAIILALNENEYDLTQDTSLWSALQTAVASALAITA